MDIVPLQNSLGVKTIMFFAKESSTPEQPEPPPPNVFDRMMSSSAAAAAMVHLPRRYDNPINGLQRLYNEVIQFAEENGCGFSLNLTNEDFQRRAITAVANCFFQVTSFEKQLYDDAYPAACKPPLSFKRFCAFSEASGGNSHKRKPVLTTAILETAIHDLVSLPVQHASFERTSWKPLKSVCDELTKSLEERKKYLHRRAEETAQRRARDPAQDHSPVENVDILMYDPLPRHAEVSNTYRTLKELLEGKESYEPVSIEDILHQMDSMRKYRYVRRIALPWNIRVIKYEYGGPHPNVYWVLKLPSTLNPTDHEVKMYAAIRSCTDQVELILERNILNKLRDRAAALLPGISPSLIREVVRVITGDNSAPINAHQAEADARVRLSIDSDGELLADLRRYNGPEPAKKLGAFWNALGQVLGEKDQAAHDRRHGVPGAAYIGSSILSIPILIKEVEERLVEEYGSKEEFIAAGNDIPSAQWVALNFMPKNRKDHRQLNYTGRFEVVYKVQKRTLRCDHPDAHYGNALQRYGREFALKLGSDKCIFISADDKARVEVGPPGEYHSTGVRNRCAPALANEEVNASDHDFDGSSITPSVYLIHDLEEGEDGNWHRGDIYVGLKDAVFQRSSPLRHAEELIRLMSDIMEPTQTVMVILTDGGPDRHLLRAGIEASWLAVARALDLDGLVVLRTVPKLSWRNPVERVMSVLNLGLQNLALSRPAMPQEWEDKMRRCNSMKDIRKLAATEGFLEAYNSAIDEVKEVIAERFERLEWSRIPIEVYPAGTNEDMEKVNKLYTDLDDEFFKGQSLGVENVKKEHLAGSTVYKSLVENHIFRSTYCWQFWKKKDCVCDACLAGHINPVRMDEEEFENVHKLPLPVPRIDANELQYKRFDQLYGSEPDPSHVPGTGKTRGRKGTGRKGGASQGQAGTRCRGRQGSVFSQTRVRGFVTCSLCCKQRCIYASQSGISRRECIKNKLDREMEKLDYTCGGELFPEGSFFADKLCVKEDLTCNSNMESQFFLCNLAGRNVDVCSICGLDEGSMVEPSEELLEQYCNAFAICQMCKDAGGECVTSRRRSNGQLKSNKRKRDSERAAYRHTQQAEVEEESASENESRDAFEDAEEGEVDEGDGGSDGSDVESDEED